eukprot:997568-Rhodomonas_salina.1
MPSITKPPSPVSVSCTPIPPTSAGFFFRPSPPCSCFPPLRSSFCAPFSTRRASACRFSSSPKCCGASDIDLICEGLANRSGAPYGQCPARHAFAISQREHSRSTAP